MGMFDWVRFETKCPICNEKVKGFQTKDLECMLSTVPTCDIDNFYTICSNKDCKEWIEYNKHEEENEFELISPSKEIQEAISKINSNTDAILQSRHNEEAVVKYCKFFLKNQKK
jgi:hypothetical protein